jgi:thiamine-monophosphate kinase
MPRPLSFRKFSLRLLAGMGLVLAVVACFNRVVDPFWYYRDVEIQGFNAVKTKFRRFERHVKPEILQRERPQAIAVGSSFAEVGFDPLNPAFTAGGRLKGFNFAVAGGPWSMTQCHFEYALKHTRVERVVMELPPGDLPYADCASPAARLDIAGPAELLFSSRALRASIETVLEQRKDKPSHTPEGQYFYARYAPGVDSRFREFFAPVVKAGQCDLAALDRVGAAVPAAKGGPRRVLDLSGLRQVVRLAGERGIELRLVVHPKHAYSLELDALCGETAERWDALRQIADAVEEAARGDDRIQLWAFYGYNAITGEPVGNTMKFWQDPQHFNPELGDLMLEAMFGASPAGTPAIGFRVTPDTVERQRVRFEREREAFIRSQPGFYAGLRKLLPEPERTGVYSSRPSSAMLSEFDIIRRYFTRPAIRATLGVGDDAALLRPAPGMELAVSTDMMVSGRHFFSDVDPRKLGHKALAVNLSDMAAMSAEPRWATLSLALPDANEAWLESFSAGWFDLADRFGVELVGGDTTRGPLNLCVQILGEVPAGTALRRDGARPDDDIWVSGMLGDAALAVAHRQGCITLGPEDAEACQRALDLPMPRVGLGLALRGLAHACIDISDGLLADLGHILERSSVAATLELDAIPRSAAIAKHLPDPVALVCLAAGGDDYELCFTAPAGNRAKIELAARGLALRVSRIGGIVRGAGLTLLDGDGRRVNLATSGFDHFARSESPA